MSSNPHMISEQTDPSTPSETRLFALSEILDALGKRSFVPFIAIPAILGLTPLGASKTAATVIGVILACFGAQLVFGRSTPMLPRKITAYRPRSRLAQYFTAWLFQPKMQRYDGSGPRLSWLTTGAFSRLPNLMLIFVGAALPVLVGMGQSIFLVCIATLIYCVALFTGDGRYVLAAGSVLSFASIGPVFQLAT